MDFHPTVFKVAAPIFFEIVHTIPKEIVVSVIVEDQVSINKKLGGIFSVKEKSIKVVVVTSTFKVVVNQEAVRGRIGNPKEEN